ncbi:cell wall hydrolase [Candidatus Gottesmanbacteria bacterium]|nr:cell wall hydrolase [Candidatus Gottesmanbacteria bacterium]
MQLIFEDKGRRTVRNKEEIKFSSFSCYHLIVLTARAKSERQASENATDDEDLIVKIDGKTFPKLNSDRLKDSPAAFSGGGLHNLSKSIYFLTCLKGREHSIILETDKDPNTATFESLQVYTIDLLDKTFTLEVNQQAEDGDRRSWITFALDDLPLKSATPTLTYSRRKRDSDDVKIIINGEVQRNILTNIKHFLWRFVGFLLPKLFPTKTETEILTVSLSQGLHYLELHADRMPILKEIAFDFGTSPPIPEGVPTVDNPKWTGDFYDDTEVMLLARTIYGEAGGEPKEAKIGVGWAIRNRVEDLANRWGKTYHEVILAEGQYDSLWNRWTYDKVRNPPINDPKEKNAWKESYDAAQKVIDGKIDDPTNGANHFYATTIPKPDWADESKFTTQIGITRFHKL